MTARTVILGSLLLLVLVGIAYFPVSRAGFVWDDDAHVTENINLRHPQGLKAIWLAPAAGNQYVPIQYYPMVHTTFWIEHRLWGDHPLGYHAVNVLLHGLNAVLLWLLLRRLGVKGAYLAAVIFALHPVHVESVAWISERKNVLSGFFYLLSALTFLRFHHAEEEGEDRPWGSYLVSLLLFVAALLSKTVTASLPAALLLVMWWKDGRITWRGFLSVVPMILVALPLALITVRLEQLHVGARGAFWTLLPVQRLLIAGRALWFYTDKLIWPSNLTFIYPRWNIDPAQWLLYLYPLTVVLVVLALWVARRRIGRGPLVAVLFFCGTLFPALGFFNVFPMIYSFVADHFQYLASIGLIALFAALVAESTGDGAAGARRLASAGVVLALALGAGTWSRTGVYKDIETLWADTLSRNPQCWMAHVNMGRLLSLRGESSRAVQHYQKALQIWPGDPGAHNNLAIELSRAGRGDLAAQHFAAAIAIWPGFVDARNNYGLLLAGQGKLDEAIAQFAEAVRVRPNHPAALFHLASAQAQKGDYAQAVRGFESLLKLYPDDVQTLNNLAWTLATCPDGDVRDPKTAVLHAEHAAKLTQRRQPHVLDTLAAAYAARSRFEDAARTAGEALALAEGAGDERLAATIRGHLAAFEKRKMVQDDQLQTTRAVIVP